MHRRSEVAKVAVAAMKSQTKLQRTRKPAGDRPLQADHRGETQHPTGQYPGRVRPVMISSVIAILIALIVVAMISIAIGPG